MKPYNEVNMGKKQDDYILLTFGESGRLLKRKIILTTLASRLLLFMVFNPFIRLLAYFNKNAWIRHKNWTLKFVRLIFPFQTKGQPLAPSPSGHIFVINHPTLNDPICTVLYAMGLYPEREIIVPVNLPWYEGICHYREELLKIGVKIVPVLTPETAKRLGSDDNVSRVQTSLIRNYTAEFAQTISKGGLAVVAQQATRQRFIFANPSQSETGEGILSTTSLILAGLKRDKLLDKTLIIPIGAIPYATSAKSKLNLFRKYTLNLGEPVPATDLAAIKNGARRPADLYILQRLAALLPVEYHYANQ
jgi:hypothetical protein